MYVVFSRLEESFKTIEAMENLFFNVSFLLAEGGYFFGITIDSAAIWSAVQKSNHTKPRVTFSKLSAHIEFNDNEFAEVGCKFTFQADDGKRINYLIHPATFCSIAAKHGLRLISMTNCSEFYEDQKKNFQSLLNRSSKEKFVFQSEQKQIYGWYTTFIFQKITQ